MDDLTSKMQELLSDPESMQQISELAAMLQSDAGSTNGACDAAGASASPPASVSSAGGGELFDPSMLMHLSELMRMQNQPDKNTALLLALKPHLGERRQLRVDKAVKLIRLYSVWKAAKASGMLNDFI